MCWISSRRAISSREERAVGAVAETISNLVACASRRVRRAVCSACPAYTSPLATPRRVALPGSHTTSGEGTNPQLVWKKWWSSSPSASLKRSSWRNHAFSRQMGRMPPWGSPMRKDRGEWSDSPRGRIETWEMRRQSSVGRRNKSIRE